MNSIIIMAPMVEPGICHSGHLNLNDHDHEEQDHHDMTIMMIIIMIINMTNMIMTNKIIMT